MLKIYTFLLIIIKIPCVSLHIYVSIKIKRGYAGENIGFTLTNENFKTIKIILM